VQHSRRAVIGAGIGAMACAGPWRAAFPQALEPIRKTIPSTGETLNPVGIGTNRFGGDAAARDGLRATLARFHALGGQLIDTAEEYGSSESVIGDLSSELGINEALFLASKVRMFGREAGIRSIEQSFERLRRETLDLMQVHDLIDHATQLETLQALKAEGRVRYIGITTAGDNDPAQTERLLHTETFDFLQLSYSLDDRSAAIRALARLAGVDALETFKRAIRLADGTYAEPVLIGASTSGSHGGMSDDGYTMLLLDAIEPLLQPRAAPPDHSSSER